MRRINSILCLFLLILSANAYSYDEYFFVSLSYEYAYWKPSEVENVDISTVGKNVAKVKLDLSPALPYLGEFQYWVTPSSRPQQEKLIEEEKEEIGLERYFGGLQWRLYENTRANDYGAIFIDYDKLTFTGKAVAYNNFEYVPFRGERQLFSVGDNLNFTTTFEIQTIGWRYYHPLAGFSVSYDKTKYRRPFNIRSKGILLDDTAYDAVFYGDAIKFEIDNYLRTTELPQFGFRLGAAFPFSGDIKFANNDSLDSLLGDYKSVGYFKTYFSLRYRRSITDWLSWYISYDYESILFSTGEKTDEGIRFTSKNEELDIAKERLQLFGIGIDIHI